MSSEAAPAAAVAFEQVTKRFALSSRRDLARAAVPIGAAAPTGTVGLADASFTVEPGGSLGIIGHNGAGKSTLLKLAAGILQPTSGRVSVAGIPASMIELGLSFHPDLTGWENLPLSAALFGVGAEELDEIRDDIVTFSGIGEHLDRPVKHFSSGMVARLGFAIATHVPSQVLLVDEVLAVGDRTFQQRCIERIRLMAARGVAILFVSHSLDLVVQICERAICIGHARIVDDGPADEVVGRYVRGAARRSIARAPSVARITDLSLESDRVPSGQDLGARCTIEVIDPTRSLSVRSELIVPAQGSGAVNDDHIVGRVLEQPGTWTLRSQVGPLVTTAGKLQLLVSLLADSGPGVAPEVIDERGQLFEVVGEDVGMIRLVAESSWSSGPSHPEVSASSPGRNVARHGDALWAEDLAKRFDHRGAWVGDLRARNRSTGQRWAVDHVSFGLDRGEAVGLIGPNGAGKSTILRILAGITHASTGTFGHRGSLVAILELGSGFHGDMTGAENLEFTWRLQGGSSERWPAAFRAIEEFADIGPYLNTPVKHYSTGMRARLSLALALELEPDVVLIDEALSVGDADLRDRVRARLLAMVEAGATVLFASHDLYLLSTICTRVLRLDAGALVDDGPTAAVISDAGGIGWAGGTSAADGGIVLKPIRVTPESFGWGESFEVAFDVEVLRPNPNSYIEFSIRETLPPEDRAKPRSPDEVLASCVLLHRVPLDPEVLGTVGRTGITGRIEGLPALNYLDVVVSIIDELEGDVLSEQWRTVFFGAEGGSHARAEVHWRVVDGGHDA